MLQRRPGDRRYAEPQSPLPDSLTPMTSIAPFELAFAESAADLRAVQALRYQVFVNELGADGPMVDHAAGLERDAYDAHCRHLVLYDRSRPEGDQAVGAYRLLTGDAADAAGGFYSEAEYDLAPLKRSGRKLLELGRSCLHRDYRGGIGMHHLWNGLARFVEDEGIEILFGTASFHGTDATRLAAPLSLLHHRHLAPKALRPVARPESFQRMDLVPEDALDRRAAVLALPALIKAYLRLGGTVGEGAWIDRDFNTIDVCLVLDTAAVEAGRRGLYTRGGATP